MIKKIFAEKIFKKSFEIEDDNGSDFFVNFTPAYWNVCPRRKSCLNKSLLQKIREKLPYFLQTKCKTLSNQQIFKESINIITHG